MGVRDSAATRSRLIEAATADFATYGIAGARVDRIAANAGVNKAQLYAYFGDKLGLFDAVFRLHADAVVAELPFAAEGLADYATGLYDASARHPDLGRLLMWARLEGAADRDLVRNPIASERKVRAIRKAQQSGVLVDTIDAADVLTLTTAMALAWSTVDAGAGNGTAKKHAERERRSLAEAVRRAFYRSPAAPES